MNPYMNMLLEDDDDYGWPWNNEVLAKNWTVKRTNDTATFTHKSGQTFSLLAINAATIGVTTETGRKIGAPAPHFEGTQRLMADCVERINYNA